MYVCMCVNGCMDGCLHGNMYVIMESLKILVRHLHTKYTREPQQRSARSVFVIERTRGTVGYSRKLKVLHECAAPRVARHNPHVPSSDLSLVVWPAPFSRSQALKKSVYSEHLCVGETKTANRVLQEKRTHFSRPVIG